MEKEGARSFSLERLLSIFTCLLASSRVQGAAYANSTGTTELFAQVRACDCARAWDAAIMCPII